MVVALALTTTAAVADAKPPVFRTWAQVHGTLANGQARFFSEQNGPYVGYGGQLGIAVLYFELFYDANVMDSGSSASEPTTTMWNQLGLGVNVPINVTDAVRVFGRADAAWVWAPYDGGPGSANTSGPATRGGLGVEYVVARFFSVGTAAYGGYNIFGARDRGDNGSYFMGQLFTRFELGL